MNIEYCIDLGDYYSTTFKTFYVRKIYINSNNITTIIKDEFEGYLNYNCFDEEDKKRAKDEARQLFQDDLNNIIDNKILRSEVNKALDIMRNNNFIESIKLLESVHKVKGHEFKMMIKVSI